MRKINKLSQAFRAGLWVGLGNTGIFIREFYISTKQATNMIMHQSGPKQGQIQLNQENIAN